MKKEQGITMVTLVVTIIILIILAGVSINTLIGDNGIIRKTKQARENIIYAGEEEQKQLNQLFWEMEQEGIYSEDEEDAKKDQMIELLQKQVEELKGQITEQEDTIKDLQNQWGDLGTQLGQTNADASHILKDYKAYSKGQLLTGTMQNYAGVTVAWSGYETISVQQHPTDGTQGLVTITNSYGYPGYYDSSSKITGNIANLNAGNIKAGVNVGRDNGSAGITGTFTSDATANANNLSSGATAYVNGQKITGNGTDVNNAYNNGYNAGYGANNKTVHVYDTSSEYDSGYWWYRSATQGVDLAKKWPNNYTQLKLFENLFPIVDQDNHNVASSRTGATTYMWRYDASTGKLYQDRGGLGHNSPCAVTVYAIF